MMPIMKIFKVPNNYFAAIIVVLRQAIDS